MTAEIDLSTIEGLADKLKDMDLTPAEGMLLKSILDRASEVENEVSGFGTLSVDGISRPGAIIATASGINLGIPLSATVAKPSAFVCQDDDDW